MDLHYSQTKQSVLLCADRFHYLMDLHYSQTVDIAITAFIWFHYLMDLHYSQTPLHFWSVSFRFTTLWIYTILKREYITTTGCLSFTTLWIYTILKLVCYLLAQFLVSLPYGFTLFSNLIHHNCSLFQFHYLMDLHYSQTSNKLRPLYSAGQIHKI